MMLLLGKASERVLDDDDRTIDDQAKVERAEAHEVRRHAEAQHPKAGQHHRDRNDSRGNQRGAKVAEQQEQHDHNEERAFAQVLCDRLDCRIDQRGAVEHRLHHHVGRQRSIDLLQTIGDRGRDVAAVLADAHDRSADNNFGAVLRRRAHPDRLSCADARNLIERDGHALPGCDNGTRKFVGITHQRVGTDRQALAIAIDEAAAHARIVALQSGAEIGERNLE